MHFIDNRGITDPRINLALEEYVLRHVRDHESYLLFYINEPSIIIGRNQNTIEEINVDVVRDRGIHVVRRVSGGGAVYHDLGNLNFSIITEYRPDRFNRYEEFTRPVVDVLHALGVPAELSGRNDILVEGRKISGNAQFSAAGRMLSHGTVLVNSNLDHVQEALNVKPGKIESKGVKSVRSRVANISEYLPEPMTAEELRRLVLERLYGADVPTRELSDEDWEKIHELVRTKYGTWEWNYGESPQFNLQRAKRFPSGEVDVRIDVGEGHIRGIRIFGDFMSDGDVADIEAVLLGVRYDPDSLARALTGTDVSSRLGGISNEEFLELVYG